GALADRGAHRVRTGDERSRTRAQSQQIEECARGRAMAGDHPELSGTAFSPVSSRTPGIRSLRSRGSLPGLVLDGQLLDQREHAVGFIGTDRGNPQQILAFEVDDVEE